MKLSCLFLALLSVIACQGFAGSPPETPSLVVSTADDVVNHTDNQTSLREAITYAGTLPGADVVTFNPSLNGATITLTSGASLTGDAGGVTIDATALAGGITIKSSGASRVVLNTGVLTLRGVKLTGATLTGGSGGGAVYSNGTLELDRCTVAGNSADFGGGALFNDGTAMVTRCTFSGNSGGTGGAIYNNLGTLTVVQSTIAGNSATTNYSIFNNAALTLRHCTVVGNPATGSAAIFNAAGRTLTIENSIFADGNAFTSDIQNEGTLTRVGANLTQSGTLNAGGGTDSGPMPIFGPPMLAALGDYGGPTQTRPPLPGSAAIDAAVDSVETSDQRGVTRPIDGDDNGSAVADLGAVEYGSTNANLAALSVSVGTLSPVFSSANTYYVADVPVGTASVTVTPTVQQASATVTVNGNAVASGAASGSIALSVGANTISVVVTSQIGTTKTYTLVVNRPTFIVTNNNDSGPGSLRQALNDTQFNGQPDMIVFSTGLSGATVVVSGNELVNQPDSGNGATIDASALPAGITIQRVSGTAPMIYNDGTMTLRAVTLRGGTNGAVHNYGTMAVERCTFTGNFGFIGSAILSGFGSNLTLRQCTLSGNNGQGASGAAVATFGGTAKLVDCTVSGNTNTSGHAGGIYVYSGDSVELENTIVAGNGADVQNDGTVTLTGANIVQTEIAGTVTGSGSVNTADPLLGALGSNGGPTQTQSPLSGSPAIDAAAGSMEIVDQRGIARPIDGDLSGSAVADIGAVEFASGNADLADLVLSEGTLAPVFAAATTNYAASVPNATTSITVTPTVAHGAATVKVNGNDVASGSPSSSIALNVGQNAIAIVVTAQDGSTKTYTVTVTRQSNDANLVSLVLSAGTLSPTFSSGEFSYTASVDFDTTSITVTPTAAQANATIKVQNTTVASGSASGSIALDVGVNTITIDVTAQDGTPKTYTVDVTRQANANLAGLSLSAGTLSPAFASGVVSYTVIVSSVTASITVTPTVADVNATVTVNGTPVNSGSASDPIELNPGTNPISIDVTAQDGTPKTYTVTVIRPYLVSLAANSGAGSLRQAILDAEANAGPDAIVFDPALGGQTINFTGSPMSVNSNAGLTIDASAVPGGVTISGDNTGSIFGVGGTAVLISLTITHGAGPTNGEPGAIFCNGTLTMIDCTLRDNSAPLGFGGAIFNFNGGNVTLERCTLSDNSAKTGGAIFIGNDAITTLRQCTLVGNTATESGGAIAISGAAVTTLLTHCTVVGNSGPFGGGIGVTFAGASATLDNSIVAGNTGSEDVFNFGTVTVTGANIIQSGINGNPAIGGGSINSVDPQLSAFGNYGGPTQTMPPLNTSPALDAAVGSTFTTDQRGRLRPVDGDANGSVLADIGAVEFASSNANLASLTLSTGMLVPEFAVDTLSYTARVPNATATLTLTPVAASAVATIAVDGTPVPPGGDTGPLSLNVGANVFPIVVTAQDGTTKTYALTVTRNTLPTAPNGTATATTGDQKTITLPFTSPDADGDPVTLTGTTPDAHLAVNSTSGADVTFTPATNYVGDATFGYAVSDGNGGTASGTITVTIADNDPPVIDAHADVSVLASDLGGVVVNYAAATATDNIGVQTITYSQDSGTNFQLGTTTVTVNATDAAGNQATPITFDVTVNLAAPVNTTVITKGMTAPGAGTNGLPVDAVIASFGVPATDNDGDLAFIAKWTSAGPPLRKGTGLFLNNTCLAIVGGDASAIAAGATWKSFSDPVVSAGRVVCLATLSGVAKSSASVIVGNLTGAALEKIAQSGDTAAGASVGGAKFKSFIAVTVQGDRVAFLAQLAAGTGTPKVGAGNDLGLWYHEPNNPLFVVRESDMVAGRTIKTLVAFKPGNGSPGAGRGTMVQSTISGDPVVSALAIFTDRSQGIISQNIDDGPPSLAVSLSGDAATGVDNGATFASYGPPARNSDEQTAFLGKLTLGPGVTKADASGIFSGPDGNGTFTTIIRAGADAVSGAKFSALKDAVLAADGGIAFPATIKGGTVRGLAMQTLWWKPPGDALALLAQGGVATVGDLPDAQWKSFTSLAIPANRGPIFAATLVPGKGDVTPKSASGVWACDFTGDLRLLFRTGVPNAIIASKTLKSFKLLNATRGSTGVTRSFNDAAEVVWLATFTDKTTAIVRTAVP